MNPRFESLIWWNSLRHAGLLLDRKRLAELYPDDSQPISREVSEALRQVLELGSSRTKGSSLEVIDFVLTEVCGFRSGWKKGPQVDTSWTRRDREGNALRPERLWTGPNGVTLPVFIDKESKTLGLGKGRRTVSRVLRWLRSGTEKLAVLTNGRQWRLLHAGLDYDAWCESDSELWFEDGAPSPQLHALVSLLSPRVWTPIKEDAKTPLLHAIEESRKGQADLSASLGERVRQSVEKLIDAHQQAVDHHGADIPPSELYRGAVRIIMRLVVVLFAEARGLLLVDNPIYHNSYGLRGLQDNLRKLGRARRLGESRSAWPRLLALFRLVHDGSSHPDMPIRGYGGELFQPGAKDSTDGLCMALWIFENACFEDDAHGVPDSVINSILEYLTLTTERIRSGRGAMTVAVPVDFSDLSSEYIGILYEGMLDYELRQVPAGEAAVQLPIGAQPILPLTRLEAMTEKQMKDLRKEFSKKAKTVGDDEGEAEEEEEAADESGDDGIEIDEEIDGDLDEVTEDIVEETLDNSADELAGLHQRVAAFFAQFVVDAGLVRKTTGKLTPERRAAQEAEVQKKAASLARAAHYPGKRYLVRWGGTRKGSGTFYTRPGLSGPTIRRTLAPLAYIPPTDSDGKENRAAPLTEWTPRKPEEILALKVCDIGAGSGTFPVGALRFLSQALWDAVHFHGRVSTGSDNRTAVALYGHTETGESVADEFLPCTPDDESYESRLRAVLKRHVAERCIYGVDIDPLAVELCRLSLWIETLDRDLPFTFLNHKVKCGNSLVGCWFDRYEEFPALALHRPQDDAGDGKDGMRSKALKAFRDDKLKPALAHWIESRDPGVFQFLRTEKSAADQHAEASRLFEQLHQFGVAESDQRSAFYLDKVEPSIAPLRASFDAWCALWFWPADEMEHFPLPDALGNLSAPALQIVDKLHHRLRFFHWELEFPDVFTQPGAGFDAILGNPPWETLQPSSKEWFSNTDPLYRTYGKQVALARQQELFADDPDIEQEWQEYCARFKSLSNWFANVALPWGDPDDEAIGGFKWPFRAGKSGLTLSTQWRSLRAVAKGYCDAMHPFCHQGEGKPYTHKLFLEQTHALLRDGGRFGVIVPSNTYTDKGSTALRRLFLDNCSWEWIFCFENRETIFDIHRSFKFCPIIVQKGGTTDAIQTAFMRRSLPDWESAESYALPYSREQVTQFSPKSLAILEIRSLRDSHILEKMYANGVLLGDDSPQGWGLKYRQGDFNMTSDSKLFPTRPQWEELGYTPDEYGHWLKGDWRPVSESGLNIGDAGVWFCEHWQRARSVLERPEGLILSRDGRTCIEVAAIDDVAIPLFEGRMINHFDFSEKGWVSGKSRSAVWHDIPWNFKVIEPQYLTGIANVRNRCGSLAQLRVHIMRITSATNGRTIYPVLNEAIAAEANTPFFTPADFSLLDNLCAILGSFAFDHLARLRIGGLTADYHLMEQIALPAPTTISSALRSFVASLNFSSERFASRWNSFNGNKDKPWRMLWAHTESERYRLKIILDSLIGKIYGLDINDYLLLLRDCDHPSSSVRSDEFTRALDPKGFWRVDKTKDPELRHTVLAQVAFQDLQSMGLDAFLAQNNGECWMLPETLRLSDYGLGHDDRAQQPQPVASRFGPRFYDWQLEGTVEESWEECRRHAALIEAIRSHGRSPDDDLPTSKPRGRKKK